MGDLHAALMLVHVSINLGIISFHIVAPEILKKKKKKGSWKDASSIWQKKTPNSVFF